MITKKGLETQIDNLVELNNMITAYEEIAAGRIKQSRESVLRSRSFMSDINVIFFNVISSYKKQIDIMMRLKKAKDLKNFSFSNKNGKTLYLLISSNTGLYGNITKDTFDLFKKTAEGQDVDKAIVGKLGQLMWERQKIKDKYLYFDFPDQNVDKDHLKKILDFIIEYQKVVVFYGKFQNLVSQEAIYTDISGTTPPVQQSEESENVKYFFEPSLAKILEFFEKQIFASIFEQVVRESQLAKISSRLTSLGSASESISKQLSALNIERFRSYHQIQNKKQLQTFSSRVLWQR